ncbi:hypothetical protein LOK74_20195 [Brevibacillus humidisoli]|uniref:hypothetical protein n=1 Tax=Brevibacillus humidisoli TaxID=2895522 RepID=UPI001E560949|nr:hypothetical protein [Brevibacillus humidisoli]UFJ40328.1 hypothetical protein LOK74_20195 [Brevibacillus humidisoli]
MNVVGGLIVSKGTDIVSTKLNIPKMSHGIISRTRLMNKLDQGMNGKLTLVCAPAGSGKTTLVGEWAQRSGVSIAWVSLDSFDDDFYRFWRCVTASIEQHIPGFSGRSSRS